MIHITRSFLLSSLMFLSASPGFAQEISPKDTEDWSRKPPIVAPGKRGAAPSDALVLFSGKQDLDKWEHIDGSPVKWKVNGEVLTIEKDATDIRTKQPFGSVQLHIEWKTPDPKEDSSNSRGNSGVFLMDQYELQIYESYHDMPAIYYNGQAASIYKQHIPLKLMSTFFIVRAPIYSGNSPGCHAPANVWAVCRRDKYIPGNLRTS